jgi:protein-S-isoprenylcysteine O-methyltransferase Ste14
MRLNIITSLLAIVAVIALALHFRTMPATPLHIAGALFIVLALLMVGTARYQLGGAFSIQAEAHHLVTTGIYARIRNPIYVGSPLMIVGLAMVAHNWWLLALLLILVPMQVRRARREASVLHAAFGDEYDRYRAHTWF